SSARSASATSPVRSPSRGPRSGTRSSTIVTRSPRSGSDWPAAATTITGPSTAAATCSHTCATSGRPSQSSDALSWPIRVDRPPARTIPPVGAMDSVAGLDVLEAEAPLHAEVPSRDVVVVGARHLHDRVVLHVELE